MLAIGEPPPESGDTAHESSFDSDCGCGVSEQGVNLWSRVHGYCADIQLTCYLSFLHADRHSYTRAYMHACVHIRVYVCTYVRRYVCTCIHAEVCMCVCVCTKYIHACMHTYIRTYIRTYVHIHIHICIYIKYKYRVQVHTHTRFILQKASFGPPFNTLILAQSSVLAKNQESKKVLVVPGAYRL